MLSAVSSSTPVLAASQGIGVSLPIRQVADQEQAASSGTVFTVFTTSESVVSEVATIASADAANAHPGSLIDITA